MNTHFAELDFCPSYIRSPIGDGPEKEDHMPSTEGVVIPPWLVVVAFGISPLFVIGAVALVAFLLSR